MLSLDNCSYDKEGVIIVMVIGKGIVIGRGIMEFVRVDY